MDCLFKIVITGLEARWLCRISEVTEGWWGGNLYEVFVDISIFNFEYVPLRTFN